MRCRLRIEYISAGLNVNQVPPMPSGPRGPNTHVVHLPLIDVIDAKLQNVIQLLIQMMKTQINSHGLALVGP